MLGLEATHLGGGGGGRSAAGSYIVYVCGSIMLGAYVVCGLCVGRLYYMWGCAICLNYCM